MNLSFAKSALAVLMMAGLAAASNPETTQGKSPAPAQTATHKAPVKVAQSKAAKAVPVTQPSKNHPQIGEASWYGKAFQGKPTASGDPYDMFQFTAAHRELPLGSYVKVTNLRNGKWLIVRVNDRGPYVGNRVMDVSYGAAQMLNFRARGLERVKLELVEPATVAMNDTSSLD
jgi:rare lipoprotein A